MNQTDTMRRPTQRLRVAERARGFTESVIREMTRVAREEGAINLAQGFPDFPAPQILKDAACEAIQADINQYAITWGTPSLRKALVEKYATEYGLEIDGDREVTVTCGATEAMASVVMALINPGDEVVIQEPFYENYGPDAILAGASPVFVPLDPPRFELDPDRLRAAVTDRTRAIILNTPNNPTGRVFSRDDLHEITRLAIERDLIVITDEIYEHILYDGEHLCLATFEGMRDRTVVISGASKTFSVTGWRIGTIIAPPDLTDAIRKVHDFLTVGAPAPLQEACAIAMKTLGKEYYRELASGYRARRDVLYRGLLDAGFRCTLPEGAYYILADFSDIETGMDANHFSRHLAREGGVTPVPGSSFYSTHDGGQTLVRFAFCKQIETLEAAAERLHAFVGKGG